MPLDKTPWTSDTVMKWGKHKGVRLEEVPSDYMLWLCGQKWIKDYPGLLTYLTKHKNQYQKEADEQRMDADEEGYGSFEDYWGDR